MSAETEVNPAASLEPTSDERMLAALAHGSVLLSFLGPIGPMLVWISQRRKSAYASFHALQAMTYQIAFFWVGMAAGVALALLFSCLIVPIAIFLENNPGGSEFMPFLFQGGFFLVIFGIWGLYFACGFAGAILSLMKKDFRYPVLGRRLESYLGYHTAGDAVDEGKEDQLVAAVCHGSAIMLMWGLISPVAIWLTQKDRSPHLRFQSLQALVYQILATLGYFVFMFVYFLSMIAFMLTIPLGASLGHESGGSVMGIAFIVFMIVILVIWGIWMLALPTYYIITLIAIIQTLKGRDYRYPLLGNFIAKRTNYAPKEV